MKISKSRLKQIIKEELEALVSEQEEMPDTKGADEVMMALEAAGVPAAQFVDVQNALANAINKGVVTKEQGVSIAARQYKKYIDQARNQLDPLVKELGSKGYVRKMMGEVAKFFNKKAGMSAAGAGKEPSSKPSAHHQRMKMDAKIKVVPLGGGKFKAVGMLDGKRYESSPSRSIPGAKSDVREKMRAAQR